MTSHDGRVPTKWLQTLRRRNFSLLQGNVYHASLMIFHCMERKLVNCDMEQVDSQKLLRVSILTNTELCKKLSQKIAVHRKITRLIPAEQRKVYYNAMIKQIMVYGSTIWSNLLS